MKSFAYSCLLAASAFAVSISSDKGTVPKVQISAKIDGVDKGEAPASSLFSIEEAKASPTPLFTMVESIEEGFETLDKHNDLAEELKIEELQDKQDDMIEEIIEEANEAAADVLEDMSDSSSAAEEVEEINDDVKDEIEDVNKDHDKEVAIVSKKSVAAKLGNELIKNDVIDEVVDLAINDAPVKAVEAVIEKAALPFKVKTPAQQEAKQPNNTLKRMVCRNGECV
jgi:hypothetical protein